MLEEQFKGYQLKGFAVQAHLDFSEDVLQNTVCKRDVRGKLQRLLPISSSDGWPLLLYLPANPLGRACAAGHSPSRFAARDFPIRIWLLPQVRIILGQASFPWGDGTVAADRVIQAGL